jgi:hypothetical protein
MKRILSIAAAVGLVLGCCGLAALPARAQYFMEVAPGSVENAINPTILLRDRQVSALNTAVTLTYDMRGIVNALAIVSVCSAGTAALTVSGSSDNINFIAIDTITAAATQVKNYNSSTVGATTAVSPLAFRWVRILVATCGVGNTSTLTVAGK